LLLPKLSFHAFGIKGHIFQGSHLDLVLNERGPEERVGTANSQSKRKFWVICRGLLVSTKSTSESANNDVSTLRSWQLPTFPAHLKEHAERILRKAKVTNIKVADPIFSVSAKKVLTIAV
jgi:hypothetical protein